MNNKLLWESLRSEYALDAKWIKVKREVVKLPSGKILDDFYIVEGSELVAIFALDEDKNLILVRQYRHAVRDVTVDLPGGGVEAGEMPIEAARRELTEETGMIARNMEKILTYYPDSGRTSCVKHIFLASGLRKEKSDLHFQDDNENIQLFSMSLEDVMNGIRNGELKEATLIIGVSAYFSKKNEM